MKYILRDYASVAYEDEEPSVYTFSNKDQVIAKLLDWCNAEARLTYEVVR